MTIVRYYSISVHVLEEKWTSHYAVSLHFPPILRIKMSNYLFSIHYHKTREGFLFFIQNMILEMSKGKGKFDRKHKKIVLIDWKKSL